MLLVLVWKKDGCLQFCIDFCKLNEEPRKTFYLLPKIQEAVDSLDGAGYFSCLDVNVDFWQIAMDKALK